MAYEMGYNDVIILSAIMGMRQNMSTNIPEEVTVKIDADKFGQGLTFYVDFYSEEIVYNTQHYGLQWGDDTFTEFDYTEVNNHLGEVVRIQYHHLYPSNTQYTITIVGGSSPSSSKIEEYDNNKVPGEAVKALTPTATLVYSALIDKDSFFDEAVKALTPTATMTYSEN